MSGVFIIVAGFMGLLLIVGALLFLFKKKYKSPIKNIQLGRETLRIYVPKISSTEKT